MKKFYRILACALLVLTMVVPAMAQVVAPAATGDMGIGIWIAIMAVAAIVLIGVLIILAKKNKK